MPVLDVCRDIHGVSGLEFLSRFAVLLIPAASGYGYENLSAAFFRVVYMPLVVAARLKCYIEGRDLLERQRIQPAFPVKCSPAMVLGFPTGIILLKPPGRSPIFLKYALM